jgi:hypothetical protein
VVIYQSCPAPVVYYTRPPIETVRAPVEDPDAAPDGWCHIKGRIVFEGDPIPTQSEIPNSKGAYTQNWVLNPENRGVKNVLIWLAPEPTADEWEHLKASGPKRLREFPSFKERDIYPVLPKRQDGTVLILEAPIAFIPHLVAVRAGSDVVFLNVSSRVENVEWVSRENGEGTKTVSARGGEFRIEEIKPERFPIEFNSNVHPWMKAWVRVFDHPYFAVTDPDGRFEIRFAPKGNLRLFVWQETAGFRNGPEGRFGEAIRVPSGRLDLNDLKIKQWP